MLTPSILAHNNWLHLFPQSGSSLPVEPAYVALAESPPGHYHCYLRNRHWFANNRRLRLGVQGTIMVQQSHFRFIRVGYYTRVSHSGNSPPGISYSTHIDTRWVLRLIHLALFLVRCFLSFSYRPWRGYRNWSFPSGRLSVEFKVKFIRQAENTEASLGETADGQAIQREAELERVSGYT